LNSSKGIHRVRISASDSGDGIFSARVQVFVKHFTDDWSDKETKELHPAENRHIKSNFVFPIRYWRFFCEIWRRSVKIQKKHQALNVSLPEEKRELTDEHNDSDLSDAHG